MKNDIKCRVDRCQAVSRYEAGYCCKHYAQIQRHGKIFCRTRIDRNRYIDRKEYYEICLYNKAGRGEEQKEIAYAKIDKEDIKKVNDYKWSLSGRGYVEARIGGQLVKLHQLIIGRRDGYITDHINHDTLDNRKHNLRFVTCQQNQMNRNGVKGFYWHRMAKKWAAHITFDDKKIHLGLFNKKIDAIIARRKAEKEYFGEYAKKSIEMVLKL